MRRLPNEKEKRGFGVNLPPGRLESDSTELNQTLALSFCLSMIFSENRFPPIGSEPEGMLFRIMLQRSELGRHVP